MLFRSREDFPDPESPVRTTSSFLGISREIFFKLCSLAPRIFIYCFGIVSLLFAMSAFALSFSRNFLSIRFVKKAGYSRMLRTCFLLRPVYHISFLYANICSFLYKGKIIYLSQNAHQRARDPDSKLPGSLFYGVL